MSYLKKGERNYNFTNGSIDFSLQDPIFVQKNKLSGKVRGGIIFPESNKAFLNLRVGIGSIFNRNILKRDTSLSPPESKISSLSAGGTLDLNAFTSTLDNFLKSKGDLIGGWSKRGYWKGETSILSINDGVISMKSRVRFSAWAKTKIFGRWIKTRLYRNTTNVTYRFRPYVKADGQIAINITDINVNNFSGEVEQYLVKGLNSSFQVFGLPVNSSPNAIRFQKFELDYISNNSLRVNYKFKFEK